MKLTYQQFLKREIDLVPLGFERRQVNCAYFCTPKGARILGASGVDGVHFCFVRGFGETVFAVSPMNVPGEYVHPVAKTFRDFLRLLLACHDAAAIEQAWQWNAAQLEDFEQKHPSDEAQRAALHQIRTAFHLRPMAEPWKYIHTVQTGFAYEKLRFCEAYYDLVGKADAEEKPWQVFFAGGFWSGTGKPGTELSLGKTFSWAGDEWRAPAAYLCREGIVLDLARRVPVQKLRSFVEAWNLSPENDGSDFDAARRMACEAESPMEDGFRAVLWVNGRRIPESHGCGVCWNPLYPEENDKETKRVTEHYRLDRTDGWSVHRVCFPWDKAEKPQTLTLTLAAEPVRVPGPAFSPERPGDCLTFRRPGDDREYTITAREIKTQPLSYRGQTLYTTELSYETRPELPRHALTLTDLGERITVSAQNTSIGVIGGADGPAAFAPGGGGACSNLRREKEKKVTWRLIFHEKRKEDAAFALLEKKEEKP